MATYGWFQSRTDEQLRTLFEGRPDLADPPPASFGALAARRVGGSRCAAP